jgi:hypothetical protein
LFTKPAVQLPLWNQDKASILDFLLDVNYIKHDPFYARTTLTHKSSGFKVASNDLISSIMDKIPPQHHYFHLMITIMLMTDFQYLTTYFNTWIHRA